MKWLSIDSTKRQPAFLVAEDIPGAEGGKRLGGLQLLSDRDVPEIARWLGLAGGRPLLDAFEVSLINAGMLKVSPVDVSSAPMEGCECLDLEHHDAGIRLFWRRRVRCQSCDGQGHLGASSTAHPDEADTCLNCDGDGRVWGDEFMTDMDGVAVPWSYS